MTKHGDAAAQSQRDKKDDAKARAWSRKARERAEAGLARDDADWGKRKLEELKRGSASR